MKKILATGLGGGLDIINASLLYFAAQKQGIVATLGSIRPAPLDRISKHKPYHDCGTWLTSESLIQYGKGIGVARYCQPKIAGALGKDVLFLTRKYKDGNDVVRLTQAIKKGKEEYGFDEMFFVDGGGDSLTFTTGDADGTSENATDPFAGGDSISLQALSGMKNAYLAVISVGLDISEPAFKNNVQLLKKRNAYYGRVNLLTGEKDDYQLDHIISFKT